MPIGAYGGYARVFQQLPTCIYIYIYLFITYIYIFIYLLHIYIYIIYITYIYEYYIYPLFIYAHNCSICSIIYITYIERGRGRLIGEHRQRSNTFNTKRHVVVNSQNGLFDPKKLYSSPLATVLSDSKSKRWLL